MNYRAYWRTLYLNAPDSPGEGAHWYWRWKTTEMCMGLWERREELRARWETNPSRFDHPHQTTVVTFNATPLRCITAQVCYDCLWTSRDLRAHHPSVPAR